MSPTIVDVFERAYEISLSSTLVMTSDGASDGSRIYLYVQSPGVGQSAVVTLTVDETRELAQDLTEAAEAFEAGQRDWVRTRGVLRKEVDGGSL